MTWDIYALRGPGGARNVEQIPQDWQPPAVGTHEEVVERLREAVPQADLSDPTWLRIRGQEWLVEAALGKAPQVHDVSFYVTGDGPEPVAAVLQVTRALRITAYDTETGEILTPESRPPVVPPPGEDDDDDDEPRRPWWRFWGSKDA